jgi:hypothetical protein
MKLVAVLVWYDEDPQLLYETVSRLGQIPVDALVAVDGARELYPGATGSSSPSNHAAIAEAARMVGMPATIHSPARPWEGSGEVTQRTFALRLAEALTEPDDWFLVVDADHILERVDSSFRGRLEACDKEVATYALVQRARKVAELSPLEREVIAAHADEWPGTVDAPEVEPLRMLYRARRGLRYGPLHWELTGPKGKLWGLGTDALLPAEDLTEVIIFEHAWDHRTEDRLRAALEYYERRDEAGLENAEVLAAARAIKAQNAPQYLTEDPADPPVASDGSGS